MMTRTEVVGEANLALACAVTCSSESTEGACRQAVDGSAGTYWQPLGSDQKENNRVWLTVDLDRNFSFNKIQLKLASGFISGYRILYSQDGIAWQEAYSRQTALGGIRMMERAVFPKVNGRFVSLDMDLFDPERDVQLIDFGIYEQVSIPPGPLLDHFVLHVGGMDYGQDDTFTMQVNNQAELALRGILTDGSDADLTKAEVTYSSSNENVMSVNEIGKLTSHQSGITQCLAVVNLDGVTKEASFYVDVFDSTEWVVDLSLEHPSLVCEIGQPAFLDMDSPFPTLHARTAVTTTFQVTLVNVTADQHMWTHPTTKCAAGEAATFTFPDEVREAGQYRINVEIDVEGGLTYFDAFYFTVENPLISMNGQSRIVHIGENGKLTYVPDFKGNQIIDFSNCGYGGGGVAIPDIAPVISLKPVEGDNTTHIQSAIDRVADLPRSSTGYRGTILLTKGVYPIHGSLQILASGIVLRGEGQEEGGTLLYATGTKQRNLIEIRGGASPSLLPDTLTSICDLYVPSGARTIHVQDASCYCVGDTVKVLRYGNERWIHAIGMDAIRMRPVTGGTVQWPPFQLEFDRVITHVVGNYITLDAPIANAIESRWGGGAIMKYEDEGRIEQIGIEYIRVVVSYDPTIVDTRIDGNEGTETYMADEQHALTCIYLDHVINAWVRNVVGFHFQHALVQVGRDTKWVTIQDCSVFAFISVITGGRRYPFHLMGELTLVQRAYTETARHAFVVDARVAGPNVFLDCESQMDYNSSEPHHRWSVGCLYDNVKGRIHIQDRAWLGSGHGWSGANYVTWNTSNELVSQQPPTAQNYAIGHVGSQGKPLLPSPYDQRQRKEAYWESFGCHVTPRSLYTQQLLDRLIKPWH
jgi:hypothetical protein